ncbi:acetyl-CoA synthetase-like protein [Trametes maxima]|nr:acetyl-CoA synthetase-like protein [Trametes maxima]
MPLDPADVPPHVTTEFRAPLDLVDKGLTIPELYDVHAKSNPNYPLFVYHDGEQRQFITYAAANPAIDRAARYIASGLGPRADVTNPNAKLPIVAILANADTITYFCTVIGVLRAGCTAFLVSTRNGAAGVADMLRRTGASQLVMSRENTLRELARDALALLGEYKILIRDMPVFEDLFPPAGIPAGNSAFEAHVELPKSYDIESWALILHSSGSTSHPKTVPWTHKRLAFIGYSPLVCELDTSRSVMGCHGTPMFHGLGAFMFGSSPICGYIVAALKPATPPTFPTPDIVWQGVVTTKSDFTWTEWGRDPEKVMVLKRIQGVFFGGAPLNQEVGDALASQGVNLFTVYGCTEVGGVNEFVRPNPGMDWAYFRPTTRSDVRLMPRDDNKYEVVVVSNPTLPLPMTNTKVDGQDAYATSDLVEPHPTKPNLWRIFGRADEQIMLSNGEKTNPLPIETIINEDPHIKHSVMFGRGRFQNGILIEPMPEFAIDPKDPAQVEAFRNKIWRTIERANDFAPRHSRIFKEMILVTSPSKPFQFNVKALPRRGAILTDYEQEIEELYKQVEESTQSDLKLPEVWDESSALSFVREVVQHTLNRPIPDDADIFRNGGDSLQATFIRNTIIRAVHEADASAAKHVPTNLIFQAPTISALSKTVLAILTDAEAAHNASRTPEELWKYVEKYSANFPARPATLVERPSAAKDVVLITGTTGGFGCDALEHLLREERVERVYAFNRKGSNALERQHAQFRTRGLDESLLNSPKFVLVEAALHEPGFGVDPALLDEVRQSVTHILHNAWKVDFNLSIHSFEHDIQGARNLVDLALSSPYAQAPSILFVGSIGVFGSYKGPSPAPEAALDDPTTAFGAGYAEGKWVTEHVLQNVTKERGVHTVVMRLGQVTGNKVGYWNEKEWFPALVKSAQFQRCLPDLEGTVSWIPGYESAKAFTEMRHSPQPFLHLVHPRAVPWHDLIAPLATELGVPLVPYATWLRELEKTASAGAAGEVDRMKANPALRLLPFFKAFRATPDLEPGGMVRLSTDKSTAVSDALANLPKLSAESARGWLAAWKRAGFL